MQYTGTLSTFITIGPNIDARLATDILFWSSNSAILTHRRHTINTLFNMKTVWQAKHTHTHTRLTALFPGLPRWAGTRKAKPIWILLNQETVSGSGISWTICKSAPRSRQIIMPTSHHSVFYRPDALPAAQPTALKHWLATAKQNHRIHVQSFQWSIHTVTSSYTISNYNAGVVVSPNLYKLTDFNDFGMVNPEKFHMKILQICPSHLSDVATLLWEIQESFSTVLFIHTSDYLC